MTLNKFTIGIPCSQTANFNLLSSKLPPIIRICSFKNLLTLKPHITLTQTITEQRVRQKTEMSSNPETNGNGGGGDGDDIRAQQLRLLGRRSSTDEVFELNTAPLFTYSVLEHARDLASSSSSPSSSSLMTPFSQYALLSGATQTCESEVKDPRIFYNVAKPLSVFICGS